MMDRDPNERPGALTGEVRMRVPLPIVVPFGALIVIAILVFLFSRILLSVPKEIATVIAMVTAANVVGACAVLALRKNMNRSIMSELAIVVMYPVIVGAVIATMGLDTGHGDEEHEVAPTVLQEEAKGEGEGVTITAAGTAFDEDELPLTAGETTEVEFINEDTLGHNISVYEDDSAQKEIFKGETITDDTVTYSIEAPDKPGKAYFQCDLHPNMNGTAIIK